MKKIIKKLIKKIFYIFKLPKFSNQEKLKYTRYGQSYKELKKLNNIMENFEFKIPDEVQKAIIEKIGTNDAKIYINGELSNDKKI